MNTYHRDYVLPRIRAHVDQMYADDLCPAARRQLSRDMLVCCPDCGLLQDSEITDNGYYTLSNMSLMCGRCGNSWDIDGDAIDARMPDYA